jgi:hypothetical protein
MNTHTLICTHTLTNTHTHTYTYTHRCAHDYTRTGHGGSFMKRRILKVFSSVVKRSMATNWGW